MAYLQTLVDALRSTWPARAAEGAGRALMAPGSALQSTPENPVTTEQMIAPAADLAGLLVGVPSGAGGLGSGVRAPVAYGGPARNYLENIVSEWAKGRMTAAQVQTEFKKSGWTADLRRGRYEVEAFDPDGNAHYLQP